MISTTEISILLLLHNNKSGNYPRHN